MALYISQPTTNKANEHPLLNERDISGRTIAPLNLLNIYGRVTEYEVAYAGYVQNNAIFLSATNRQAKLLVSAAASGHLYKPERILWSPPHPYISFVCKSMLKETQQTGLIGLYPNAKISFTKSGQFLKCLVRAPADKVVDTLLPISQNFSRANSDELTIGAWRSYRLITLIVNEFLATNSYSAFYDPGSEAASSPNMLEFLDVLRMPSAYVEYSYKKNAAFLSGVMEKAREGKLDEAMAEDAMTIEDGGSLREIVAVAKPSPYPADNNFGPPSALPNYGGIFFPYFHRLVVPDYATIPTIIGVRFLRFLGSTIEECDKIYQTIRSSWTSIATTKAGMILAHVLFGIRLCLETQTRLFVVQTGEEYHGFALLGAKFGVFDGEKFVLPVEPGELRTIVSDHCSEHYKALQNIADMCSNAEMVEIEGTFGVTVEELTGGLSVMEEIGKRKWTEAEMKELQLFLGKLSFGRNPWPVSGQTLVRAIHLLSTNKATPMSDEEYPSTAGPDIKLFTSRTYRVLSCFGPTAPSFRNRAGDSFAIPPMDQRDEDNEVGEGQTEKRMKNFMVSMKKLKEATEDWEAMVKKTEVRMDQKERAAKYRNVLLAGKSRDEVWKELRICIPPLKPVDAEVPGTEKVEKKKGKKRAEEDESVDDYLTQLLKKARND